MKKWYWYLLGFGVFTGLVIVLLVYGISTHEEPGLMEDWGHWSRDDFPLTVEAYRYNAEEPERVRDSALEEAFGRANARLGFTAFEWAADRQDGRIEVMLGAPAEEGWLDPGGDARKDAIVNTCFVRQANTAGAGDLTVLVLYHELGHCLGLAHDDYRQSIMYPEQRPTPDRQIPPWISDWDRELLRGRYAP